MSGSDNGATRDALGYLTSLVNHELTSVGISAGVIDGLNLEGPRKVLEALGRPDKSFRSIHITGTNGKGSVALLSEALLVSTGLRVGTYMSPEGTVNERIRVDREPVVDEVLAEAITTVRGVADHLEVTLSAFEAITLCALVVFADSPVDVAVIEVGLLGRFDATNIIDSEVAVVTNIGGDHTDFGPRWKERIAEEKAGIIRSGAIALLGDIDEDLTDIFRAEKPDSLLRLGHDFYTTRNDLAVGGRAVEVLTSEGTRLETIVPLHGSHQGGNLALAAEAVESLMGELPEDETVSAALEEVSAPGRVEVVSIDPLVIIDGAHNAEAATALGDSLGESFAVPGRRTLVLGSLKGRDPALVLEALTQEFPVDQVIAVGTNGDRGLNSSELAALISDSGIPISTASNAFDGVRRAFQDADVDDIIVVAGTFRIQDDARAAISTDEF